MSPNETRSPIKDKPLRLPGQSLMEERRRLFEDKIEPWLLVSLMLAGVAALEWWRHFRPSPPAPWLFTAAALVPLCVGAWRLWKLRPVLRQLRQGEEGEQAVGQYLERLREQGYQVFHDIPCDGFNIDHVCIGPAGLFTIETKTWSKPVRGDARVRWDGKQLTVDGFTPERDPVAQAQGQSRWLSRLIDDSTGRRVPVQAVLVFPGWFVETSPGGQQAVWVMEPKGLPTFLHHEPQRLRPEDVKLCAFHLSRYVRGRQRDG
jgi:hypothetical protein